MNYSEYPVNFTFEPRFVTMLFVVDSTFEDINEEDPERDYQNEGSSIIEMNDHQDETIFYLKVDIEGDE